MFLLITYDPPAPPPPTPPVLVEPPEPPAPQHSTITEVTPTGATHEEFPTVEIVV